MKSAILNRSLIAGACAAFVAAHLSAAGSPREHLSLDCGWKFHLGDDWPGALRLDKAGASGGPASENLRKWDSQIRRDRNHPSACLTRTDLLKTR